eukprot:TRINITY_DN41313_c0_g1_i2.p1 TRINITY_DN41313_c0_g1~~TRINITY_DN41313_c0_g1_i2.p1  ORF type:complete len:241 (+),score=93.06 TRINITY_DN41313_c0_g1_i2:246-968(+)
MSLLGSSSGAAPAAKQKAKRGRTEPGANAEEDEMRKLVGMIGRLTLSATTKVAMTMGALTDVLILSEESVSVQEGDREIPLNEKVKVAMRAYSDEAKSLTGAQKSRVGPPHVRVWDTMMQFLEKHGAADEALMKAIAAHREEVMLAAEDKRAALLAETIRICKVTKNFQRGMMRIEVAVRSSDECTTGKKTWAQMKRYLVQKCKAEVKHGKAPADALQRKTTALMTEMGMLGAGAKMEED